MPNSKYMYHGINIRMLGFVLIILLIAITGKKTFLKKIDIFKRFVNISNKFLLSFSLPL